MLMTPKQKRTIRKGLVVAALLLLSATLSCTSTKSLEKLRRSLSSSPPAAQPPSAENLLDVRGAIHVHSYLSHDSQGRPEEILQAAADAGLDFIIMTDHTNPKIFTEGMEGWQGKILVIRGMEIIQERASLLAIGMKEFIDHKQFPLQEVVDRLKADGVLVFAAHPRTYPGWRRLTGLDGIEIYDIFDDATDHKSRYFQYFVDILFVFNRYPDEVFLSILDRPEKELLFWDQATQSQRLAGLAGNDAHQNVRVLGRQLDPYSRSFRFVNTHLLVPALDPPSLLNALAAGRGYIAFDILAEATGFLYGAQDKKRDWRMGEEVPFHEGIELYALTPQPGRGRLIKDGVVVQTAEGTALSFYPKEKGVYRVEWLLHRGDRWWPWIYSNPIYLR
ncbi:MAG: PHP domain-containing protein [Candidatus Manganitrophaceae bacterium]|nr:MAG: PHP domain-containing protein [Candidatus Manganitrophaceae bacterium]